MAESRDEHDPRDAMRGMRKEARAEFDAEEASDTGGQEHGSRADREGATGGGGNAGRGPTPPGPGEPDES